MPGFKLATGHRPPATLVYSAGTMLTNLPIRPRSRNSITPEIFANSVSSLPRPTFTPGLILVPRCRTMIDPPGTSWPPNAFTPRRCAFESRPFLELPKPFLCAMLCSYVLLGGNLIHLDTGEVLAMSDGAPVLFLALEFKYDYLVGPAVRGDRRFDARRFYRRAGCHGVAVHHGQDAPELHVRSDLAWQCLYLKLLARCDAILLPACFNDCVH